jgi:tetratricopeptide (TPR) repeat protein
MGLSSASAHPTEILRRFAGRLEGAGSSREAALEYKRMLFFSRTREDSLEARMGLARALEAAGAWREAYSETRAALALDPRGKRADSLAWESLRLLSRLSDAESAREKAYAMLEAAQGPAARPVLRYLAALEIAESQPEQAIRWADRLAGSCPESGIGWTDSLKALLLEPPPKSPVLAMVLSGILPGTGQWYAGVPAGALNSLLLNGLTGYGLVHGFLLGRPAETVLYLGFFERVYVGGIQLARARAEDANLERSKRNRRRALEWVAAACTGPAGVSQFDRSDVQPIEPGVSLPGNDRIPDPHPGDRQHGDIP